MGSLALTFTPRIHVDVGRLRGVSLVYLAVYGSDGFTHHGDMNDWPTLPCMKA